MLGDILSTFFVAMLPVAELRGAIPVGLAHGLSVPVAFIVSVIGNMVPVPFIILLFRRIITFLKGRSPRLCRIGEWLETHAGSKAGWIYKYEVAGLILLVAIPLPGTGAWTGAALAAMLSIRVKVALPAIFAGVVIAGILISGLFGPILT